MKINVLSCLFLAATAKAMILSSSSDSISILEKRQTPPNEPNPSTSQQSNPSTSQQSHPPTSQQSNPPINQQSNQNNELFKPYSSKGPFRHILDGAPPLKASDFGYDDDGTPLDKNDPRCKELSTTERCIRAADEMTPSAVTNNMILKKLLSKLQKCQEKYERMELRFKSYSENLNQQRSSPYKPHRKITFEKLEAQAQKCGELVEEVEKMMGKIKQEMHIIVHYNKLAAWFEKKPRR
ncbi:hypothetical protein O5D80_005659 [Batrachochytrium dendrobatidis]|nr:hypothetical protein O5D80_005659 [Batrachochytrium dendrobatidis]